MKHNKNIGYGGRLSYTPSPAKSYFAKLLPIEGDIKEGDKVQTNNGGIVEKVIEGVARHINKNNTAKKVKLFLCSRDIQVGDKITNPRWGGEKLKEGIDIVVDQDDLEYLKEVGCYKVIGEISPEVIFVKEGDEFNEDEVKKQITSQWSHSESYFDTEHQEERERDVFTEKIYYQIKGPCGHFH